MMKFIAADVEAAKAKARRALGDRVFILSVRDLPSGDVEVSASDRPEAAPPEAIPQPAAPPQFGAEARRAIDDAAAFEAGGGSAQGRSALGGSGAGARLNEPLEQKFTESHLSRLSDSLACRREPSAPADLSDAALAGVADLLRPHGIDEALLSALAAGARRAHVDDDYYRLETAFSDAFSFTPLQSSQTGPLMLVGPTGAGKTSCAAKLAAAAMERDGAAFLITADVGRAGAIEQVQTYGDTLGADYYIVETPLDVAQALRSKRPNGCVILDTPGVSPFDAGDFAALQSFREAANAEPVLVLPASGDADEYKDWATAFAGFGAKRMIITKFDATKRVGAGLTAAHAGNMALANFSETPFISEGMLPASAAFLARRLLASRPGRIGA